MSVHRLGGSVLGAGKTGVGRTTESRQCAGENIRGLVSTASSIAELRRPESFLGLSSLAADKPKILLGRICATWIANTSIRLLTTFDFYNIKALLENNTLLDLELPWFL